MVEVSDGRGQVARACEDRGFKHKTWVRDGFAAAQALPLALRHHVRKQRLLAVVINFQQSIPVEVLNSRVSLCQRVVRLAVSRRLPVLVCLPTASPLSHRLHHELKSMESVHTLRCAGCAFGAKWAQRLDMWSARVEKHDLSSLVTRCTGARGLCSWSRQQHHSRTYNHLSPRPPSLRTSATAHPPFREHPMLRGWVGKVNDFVPSCVRVFITVTWFEIIEPSRSFHFNAFRNVCFVDPIV